MDKVRFRFGFPEKIGGWVKYSGRYFLGTCRALHPWVALDQSNFLGVGTNDKYYISRGGGFDDITPIRSTTAAGDVTFSASYNALDDPITAVDTVINLVSVSGFPASGTLKIGNEQITYNNISGLDLSGCIRGVNGTTASSHSVGDAVNLSTLIVSDTNHGAKINDFVTYSGAVSLGGNITADVLNQEYEITSIVDDNSYYIQARELNSLSAITEPNGLNPTYVFANSSDSGSGGTAVIGAYQINVGLNDAFFGNGWGVSFWGRNGWGSGTSIGGVSENLRIWTHDNFGENLIINVKDSSIFYWDRSASLTSFQRAVNIVDLQGSNLAPTIAKKVLVSDIDRHVVAFGCDSQTNPGVQDPLLIRFSDQENILDWASTVENTAGDLRIGSGSEIVTAVETRQQVLVFTDVSLHAMQFIGPPFTFGITGVSENITIAGPLAAVAVEDNVFWMGVNEFYVYGGAVQRLPCSVRDYVFSNFNFSQSQKVFAFTNTAFSEVSWFYPSKDSSEIDRYVTYNYQQKIWYYGSLSRTAWIDRGVVDDPVAAATDASLYRHEVGTDDGATSPVSGITSYIESSQMDLGEGDQFAFLTKIIPDITFRDSTADQPTVTMTLETRNFPGANYSNSNSGLVVKTASVPVEQFTDQFFLRLRGRSFNFKIESSNVGVKWRLGSPRVEVRLDGRR
tara:strand:+ start:58 stop:2097 length:2040 start_codon:yes stop_codon:yes gene_type:complete